MAIGREVKLLVGSLVLLALAAVLVIQYTDVCRLEAVTLNGQQVNQWYQRFGLRPDLTVIRQPVDSIANALLSEQGITRVEIQYRLPNMLNITTNRLDPVCYMIDRVTGTFFGLDESGRVVPIDISQSKWDMPIFTGLRVRRLHDYTDDYRANVVIPQLQQIKQTEPALYESIEEVDFSRPNYVGLGLSGRTFRLRLPAAQFTERFGEFNEFVSRYRPPLDSTSCFDLTYDDEIIRIGATMPKKAPAIDSSTINDKSDFSEDPELMPPTTLEISSKENPPIISAPSVQSAQEMPKPGPIRAASNKPLSKDADARTLANEHSSVSVKPSRTTVPGTAGQAAHTKPVTSAAQPGKKSSTIAASGPVKPQATPAVLSGKSTSKGTPAVKPKAAVRKKPVGKKTKNPAGPQK